MQCPKLACHQVQEDICDVTKLNIIIKEIDSKKGKGKTITSGGYKFANK